MFSHRFIVGWQDLLAVFAFGLTAGLIFGLIVLVSAYIYYSWRRQQ